MVVLANPGAPQEIEDEQYAVPSETVAAAAWTFTEAVLERQVRPSMGAGRSATHDVLMRHLAGDVFECPVGEVLDRVVVTNAVRCSTPRNFGEYPPEVRTRISTTCVSRHLLGEISYWRPSMIVACGKPAREALTDFQQRGLVTVPCVETHHPSALGRFIAQRKAQFRAIGERLRAARESGPDADVLADACER